MQLHTVVWGLCFDRMTSVTKGVQVRGVEYEYYQPYSITQLVTPATRHYSYGNTLLQFVLVQQT